jgi:hypothetical protein
MDPWNVIKMYVCMYSNSVDFFYNTQGIRFVKGFEERG